MKKVVNTIVALGYLALAMRGCFAVVDDVCKFIDKRKEAKKNAGDSVDECIGPTVTAP